MKKILVVVDMQNDFISGPLGNSDCVQAVSGCVNLCENGNFDYLIFTRDTHFENYNDTLEGIKLPVKHCIKDSFGWEIIPELQRFTKQDNAFVIDKYTFGSIENQEDKPNRNDLYTVINGIISSKNKMHQLPGGSVIFLQDECEIHFCGVCTSICVLSNMAIQRAYFKEVPIVLHKDATGDVTEEMKQAAFTCAKAIQCEVV